MATPEPGTEEARDEGCTCQTVTPNRWGDDPEPTVKRDEWCPLHGRDPDYERERRQETKGSA